MVTTGIRRSLGLFMSPLNSATGLGIAAISLAMAVSQLVWGVAQPLFGALADRYGALSSLVAGTLLLALALAAAVNLPIRERPVARTAAAPA